MPKARNGRRTPAKGTAKKVRAKPVTAEGSVPILRVGSLEKSIRYYCDVLGFALDWQEPGVLGAVSRDKACVFLCEGDQGHPGGWAWIGVSDAALLHEELKARGARIWFPPTNHPWALEVQVEDIDGNVLRFGSEPLEGVPFGPWKDGQGRIWEKNIEGGWTQVTQETK